MKTNWVKVSDSKVRQVWQCETCGKVAYTSPGDLAEVGTPICTGNDDPDYENICEGDDMVYVRTEIRK